MEDLDKRSSSVKNEIKKLKREEEALEQDLGRLDSKEVDNALKYHSYLT